MFKPLNAQMSFSLLAAAAFLLAAQLSAQNYPNVPAPAPAVSVIVIQDIVNGILFGEDATTRPGLDFNLDGELDVVDIQEIVNAILQVPGGPIFNFAPFTMQVNQPFGALYPASGGVGAPYQFHLSSGALPPGLTMTTVVWPGGTFGATNPTLFPAGTHVLEISGTPTTSGNFPVAIELEDSAGTKALRQQDMVVDP